MTLVLHLLFVSFHVTVQDICTKTVILKPVDSFHIAQPQKQINNLDFGNYKEFFSDLDTSSKLFQGSISNYTDDKILKQYEPDELIPYLPEENLIIVTGANKDFPEVCSKRNGYILKLRNSYKKE